MALAHQKVFRKNACFLILLEHSSGNGGSNLLRSKGPVGLQFRIALTCTERGI